MDGVTNLTGTLEQFARAAAELLAVLQAENQLLSQKDTEGLQDFVPTKEEKLTQFEKSQVDLLNSLAVKELSALPDALDTKISLLPADQKERATTLWKHIVELLRESSELNKVNGGIVQKNLQVTRRKIDVLTSGDETLTTYDKEGKI